MPPESLTLAVTSGFGVGIIAGIVSGVCYVIFHGFSDKRAQNPSDDSVCNVCGKTFFSTEVILGTKKIVTCEKCQRKVCKLRCSSQNSQKLWICEICQHSESWFKGILKTIGTKPKQHPDRILAKQTNSGMNETQLSKRDEKEQVRDFIERLVESILGDNVDDISVTRIYNEEQYLPIIGQSPCSAHSNFKQLIQKIVQDAIGLPKLKKVQDSPTSSEDKSYENLLSTAIINKVVLSYQEELAALKKNKSEDNKEYFFGGETLDTKWKNTDIDSTSASSLEEWMRSDDSSGVSSKYVDSASLTVDDNEDEVKAPSRNLKTTNEPWKNNWLMQENKLKLSRTSSPVPVPMLVPNPTSEAKVLIGDREAEDTTDLSDAGSDVEDTESVSSFENFKKEVNTPLLNEPNEEVAVAKMEEEVMLSSIEDGMEQDSEYTEKYATLPKTIMKPPSPVESTSTEEESPKIEKQPEKVEEKRNFVSEQFKGGYSEREKQKWNNAVEMKNNPYSAENLKERLSNPIVRYGRDYYVKAAANSAGTRKKLKNDYKDHNMINDPVYKAVPVYVTASPMEEDSSIETSSSIKSIMELSSDSDKSIERIYNLNSGKVYEKLPESSQEVITGSKNPLGVKTEVKINKLDLVFDENHNSTESLTKNLDMDPEIKLLKDQHLVKSRLGQFSKSSPTLSDSVVFKENSKVTNSAIYDLKLKFNCKQDLRNDKLDQIYSLTARSIPSQVRKELQETPSEKIEIRLDAPEPEQIVDEEFPVAKNMIQFYEDLKNH